MRGRDIMRLRRIAVAGLWVGFMIGAGTLQAAECQNCDDTAAVGKPLALSQYTKRHIMGGKKTSYPPVRKTTKLKPKPPATRLSKQSADPASDALPVIPQDLPDSIANANAALTSGDLIRKLPPALATAAEANPPPVELISGVQIASADQLNDIDRAFLAAIPSEAAAEVSPPRAQAGDTFGFLSATHDDESWRRASLIGKILIAFGAMLTLGSILRMMLTRRALS